MTSTELQEQIERSFGHGPAHPPVEHRIAAGRQALVRRRVASGAAALAVLAVIGTGWYAMAPGDPLDRGSGQIAVDPTRSPSPTPSPAPSQPASRPWEDNLTARYADDGELEIRPGVVVHEHIENPYRWSPPKRSDALDITWRGHRMWTIVELTTTGLSYSSSTPSNGWASFADYVADQVRAAGAGGNGWPETLRLTDRGTVVAAAGSEVLQRTDDPRLGASFADPGAPTGAAQVRVTAEDQAYFVVWRVIGGKLDVITTPPRDVVGATFEELLSYARGQYASGEGMR